MRLRTGLWFGLVGIVLGGATLPARAADEKKPSEEEQAALKLVEKRVLELKGQGMRFQMLTGAAMPQLFPGQVFISGYMPSFPVTRIVPEGSPLKSRNLFVVKDGKVQHLADSKELEKFFQKTLSPAKKEEALKDVARAWLLLVQAFYQDGFFRFVLMDETIKATPAEKNTTKVAGRLVAMSGGNGWIEATLTFDETGKLTEVTESSKLRSGPRPICQATKLLDADPIVRQMAEQDLRIMGRAAFPYLAEQHAKAGPELKKAIEKMRENIRKEE